MCCLWATGILYHWFSSALVLKLERNSRFTGKEGETMTAAITRVSEKPSLQN